MKIVQLFFYQNIDRILDGLVAMLTKLDKYIEAQIAEESDIAAHRLELDARELEVKQSRERAQRVKDSLSAVVN